MGVIRDYDKTRTTLTLPQGRQAEKAVAAQSFPPDAKKIVIPSPLPRAEKAMKPLAAAEKTQLRRDYLAGVPIARMAASLGRTEGDIRSALLQMGLIV